jgi:hypothetical protein
MSFVLLFRTALRRSTQSGFQLAFSDIGPRLPLHFGAMAARAQADQSVIGSVRESERRAPEIRSSDCNGVFYL